jgi:hypothetical protein
MAYRNGTYVAFHAAGTSDPTASDMKYYRLLCAWKELEDRDFAFVNSHQKAAAVRDSSSKERLRQVLAERLRNSRNMVLILGKTTRFDRDWIPWEIEYAVDTSEIPIIAVYPAYAYIQNPRSHVAEWPAALAARIRSGAAHVIHVPFKRGPLADAIQQFDHDNLPLGGGLGIYDRDSYTSWGIYIPEKRWTATR